MVTEPRSRWVFFDNGANTARAADAYGVLRDLERASDFGRALLSLNEPAGETEVMDALFIAGLVQYGRAFSTGKRNAYKAREVLAERVPSDHQYFMDLRDLWLAHSVNTFECNRVAAVLTEGPDQKWDVNNFQAFGEDTRALVYKVPQFLDLCESVIALVRADFLAEMAVAEQEMKSLSYEELDALPSGFMSNADLERPDRERTPSLPRRS